MLMTYLTASRLAPRDFGVYGVDLRIRPIAAATVHESRGTSCHARRKQRGGGSDTDSWIAGFAASMECESTRPSPTVRSATPHAIYY
jgi:hypothetical protein